MTAETFFVGTSNTEAHTWIQKWPEWPAPGAVIYGPAGCGKTHLGEIWRTQSRAVLWCPTIHEAFLKAPPLHVLVDWELVLPNMNSITFVQLLEVYNTTIERGGSLLFLACTPPARWRVNLRDLTSRLNALPAIAIHRPDDALLLLVMRKLFSDIQVSFQETWGHYLLRRIPRSFASVRETVMRINQESLRLQQKISIDLIRRVLDKM
jgi:chromosomal replication initiation ATPase DnaA